VATQERSGGYIQEKNGVATDWGKDDRKPI